MNVSMDAILAGDFGVAVNVQRLDNFMLASLDGVRES